jgi:hypothetical protein
LKKQDWQVTDIVMDASLSDEAASTSAAPQLKSDVLELMHANISVCGDEVRPNKPPI